MLIKQKHYFKKVMGILLAAAVLLSTAVLPTAAAAESMVIEDFETITDISQNAIFIYRPTNQTTDPAQAYANIVDGALHFGKTVGGVHELRVDLASAIGSMKDYTVSFDYTGTFSGSSMNIKLGGCFAFENAAGAGVGHPNPPAEEEYRHVFQWWNGDPAVKSWDKTNMTTYDLSKPVRIDLAVRNQEMVDVYINGELIREGLLYRESPFTQLHLQMNNGLRGEAVLDNLTITEGSQPPVSEDVLYTQDFSNILDISEDPVLYLKPGSSDAAATIENEVLKFGKTEKGDGKEAWVGAEFADLLTGIDDYLVSFDLQNNLEEGGSFNLRLGGCIVIRPQTDNTIIVGWHDGTAWHEEDRTKYDAEGGANIKLVIHGRSFMDVYVNNILAVADVPQRQTASYTKLDFEMSKNTVGDIYLDNLLLTTDTTVEEEEPPAEEEIENAVTASDMPVVGAPEVAKENFDLYLAIGQSNMAGRAELEAQDRIFIPNAYLFNADGAWERAQAQYYEGKWEGMNRYSTVQKNDLQGLSPAFYFAKTLAETVGEEHKIGIISNARGNTKLAQWQKGYTADAGITAEDQADYDLYENAVERAKAAVAAGGTLKGIIWHQGCADLGTDTTTYINNFKQMIENLRTDLGAADLPVIIGEIPGYGRDTTTINNRMSFNQRIIAKLPQEVSNCWAVSSAGSRDKGDLTHFDAKSQRRLGKLYGQVALEQIYGIAPELDNVVPLQNVTAGGTNGAAAADTVANIQDWSNASTYWTGAVGDSWEADFGGSLMLTELRSYFRDPYNTVVQYKVYLNQNGVWNQVIDNSGITAYETVDINGAVVDVFETPVLADAVRFEVTGVLDYNGQAMDSMGSHEFVVYTSDLIQGTRVAFRGYSGEAEIPVSEADTIELTAASPSGIQDIKVYANGVLIQTLTESPYLLNISELGIGRTELRAVATAKDGITAEATLSLTIAGLLDHSLVEDSTFETETGTTLKSGILLYPQRGYVKVEQIDEEHGNSLLVGIETVNEEYSSGNLPYINIPLGGIADEFSVFCDLYVDAKDTSGDKRFSLYQASGNEMVLLRFRDQMTLSNSNTNPVDYETGRWYSFRIDIDMANHTAVVFRDEEQIGTIALGASMTAANYIRLYGPRNDTVPSYTAIDNLRIVKYFRIPSILSVDEDNIVSASAESFTVQLDDVVYGSSVNAESVWLQDNMGVKTSVKDAKWSETDKSITVTPARKLASGSSYQFVLGGDVELSAGVPIRYPVRAAFRTEAEGVEIQEAQISEEAGTKKAEVTLYNATDSAAEGFVVMTLWNGNEFCGMAVQACNPAAGATQEIVLTHAAPAGATVELVVYDSLDLPKMLCGSVYRGQ